ncbi:hypothetical protein [Hyalangium minutum]|uniref:Putative lipoprotein n=1 Tax=Hyalangium minutum TaxID=394096 RepID=A0A085WU62_9BACT|nr:hypothetical protein [Hyalangium minutum]KFE71225.1 putative lipoprotein [Hyalangium minutum]
MRAPVLLCLSLAVAACGPEFELQQEIRRVRVLAIKAEPAEITFDPDAPALPPPVVFSALAVAPDERDIGVTLALCRPGNAYSSELECPGKDGATLPQGELSLLDPNVQQILQETAEAGGGGGDGGSLDLNDPQTRAVLEKGVPLFIGYKASDGSETPEGTEEGVRRLTLKLTATPNQNPRMADILLNDAPLAGPLPLSTELVLRPQLAEGSLEQYEAEDGPRTEQVFYSWFATGDGEVKQLRSLEPVDGKPGEPTIQYVTPSTPQRVTIYVVARDGRGGVDWLSRTLDVGP